MRYLIVLLFVLTSCGNASSNTDPISQRDTTTHRDSTINRDSIIKHDSTTKDDSIDSHVDDIGEMEKLITIGNTNIILIRHAEKSAIGGNDPDLSADGKLRADELSRLLSTTDVANIYSTAYKRTRQTVTPLAASKSITISEYAATKKAAELISQVMAENVNKTAVIVMHSNTITDMIKELGFSTFTVTETDFDNIFVYSRDASNASKKYHVTYGALTQ